MHILNIHSFAHKCSENRQAFMVKSKFSSIHFCDLVLSPLQHHLFCSLLLNFHLVMLKLLRFSQKAFLFCFSMLFHFYFRKKQLHPPLPPPISSCSSFRTQQRILLWKTSPDSPLTVQPGISIPSLSFISLQPPLNTLPQHLLHYILVSRW